MKFKKFTLLEETETTASNSTMTDKQKPQDLIDSMLDKVRDAAVSAYRERLRQKVNAAMIEIAKEKLLFQRHTHSRGVREGRYNSCEWFLKLLDEQP